jgi:hypothetical protein
MDLDQADADVKFVLHDRDAIFHEGFDAVFTAAGLRIVRSGVRMPRTNSIMEWWIGGCRRELLDRTLIWNLPHLRRILAAFERHHNDHRPHMALSSAAPLKPLPGWVTDLNDLRVRRHDRVGGVIHEYQQTALPARTTLSARTSAVSSWGYGEKAAYAGGGPLRPRAVCTSPPAIIDPGCRGRLLPIRDLTSQREA